MPYIEPFEKYSDAYDRWFERNRDLYEAELEAIGQLTPHPGALGLEVGVGSGKFAAPLGVGIGVDPSIKMITRARKRGVSVCAGIAESLPFPDMVFDFVLMVTTICFVSDVAKSIRETYRVLKTGGYIIVGFVDRESELGREYNDRRSKSKFYRGANFFSAKELLSCLENGSFKTIKIIQTLLPEESESPVTEGYGKGAFVVVKGLRLERDVQ
jgi:SAM-dependent methyltransferase